MSALQKTSENDRYREFFLKANDAIFLMRDDKFVECNPKTLEIFDCKENDIIGRSPYDHQFSPPKQPDGKDSKEKALEKIKTAFSGEAQTFDWKHLRYGKEEFYAQVSLNKIVLDSQDYLIAVVRDISAEKEMLNKLKLSQERLSKFMNASSDLLYILDKNLDFVEINSKGLEIIGKERDEVVGKNIVDIVPDVETSGRYEKHLEVLRTGKPYTIDHFIPHPVFGDKHFILKSFRVGNGLGVSAIDVTDLKKTEQKLKEKIKELRKLTNLMVGRELKMSELKSKIEEFEEKKK